MFEKYKNYVPFDKMLAKDNVPEYIVVHHSASKVDNFEIIQRYHITDKDHLWENFGYHYCIERDGKLVKGRPEGYHGGHVKEQNMNKRSIGICLCGDFDQTLPTPEQTITLKNLLEELTTKYKIPKDKIVPHRKFAVNPNGTPYKSCFGKLLADNWASGLVDNPPNTCLQELEKARKEVTELRGFLNWMMSSMQSLLNKFK